MAAFVQPLFKFCSVFANLNFCTIFRWATSRVLALLYLDFHEFFKKNECWRLIPSSLFVNSSQIFDKTGFCGHFLAGRRFFPVKQLLTLQRLHLIGPRLQVHVDDVKCAWASAIVQCANSWIKIGWILGSLCRLYALEGLFCLSVCLSVITKSAAHPFLRQKL